MGGNRNSHHSCKFAGIISKNKSCCAENVFLCLITAACYWWVLHCAVCLNTWSDKLWKPNPQHSQNSAWAFNPRKQICICVPALVEWIIDYHYHTAYDASRDYGCCRMNKRQILQYYDVSIRGYKGSFSQWAGFFKDISALAPCYCFLFLLFQSSQLWTGTKRIPVFPHNCGIVEKRLSSFSWKPMSTLQAVQLLKQKREMLMSEWRKISRCTPSPETQLGRTQFLREAARQPPHWRHVQFTLQLARSFICLPRLALIRPLIT